MDMLKSMGINTEASIKLFMNQAVIKKYTKGKILFAEGKRNANEYLVLSGILHRFNTTEDGKTVTTGFYLDKSVVTPHFARTVNNKSIFSLQSVTDVEIAEIAVEALDNLRRTRPEFREFGQKVLEQEVSKNLFHEVAYRSLSAKDRLLRLRKEYPNLENRIPHHIIASYLGITNVSFSRLRSEFLLR